MKGILKIRDKNSHKGSYGRLGIIGGSRGMTGAPYLAASAALRTGSGLVYSFVPEGLETIMPIKLVEAIVKPVEDSGRGCFSQESIGLLLAGLDGLDALALGPGMGLDEARVKLVRELIGASDQKLVVDADGINALALIKDSCRLDNKKIVITPHPGEMARMLGRDIAYVQANRLDLARELASNYGLLVVLKGWETIVTDGEEVYINRTGNPGMATAGSGDVLTGIIASFLGQKLGLFEAAKLGVYVHGLAGDLAREVRGEYGLIARDIIDNIPRALVQLLEDSLDK